MVEAFNRMADVSVSSQEIITEAETTGRSYLVTWLDAARSQDLAESNTSLLDLLSQPSVDLTSVKPALEGILQELAKRPLFPIKAPTLRKISPRGAS
jgi:hypothetical protein